MTDLRTHPVAVPVLVPDDGEIVGDEPPLHQVVVVAPSTGRLQPVAELGSVEPGQLLGYITGGGGRADEVRAPIGGVATRLLRRTGLTVRRGTALWWLEP